MTSLGAFLLILILGTALCAPDWAYEEGIDGALRPKEWGNGYVFCNYPNQSPVNLVKNSAKRLPGYEDNHYLSGETHFSNVNLTNNGLYLVLKSDDMSEITFNRKGIYDYQLAEIRFHWGSTNSVGSDHKFNGKSYPMEMQLMFYNPKYYDSFEENLRYGYGLGLVAVEFQISSEDNEGISDVVSALDSIQEVSQTKTIEKMKSSFVQLLPSNRKAFYVYQGSMTSPPCAAGQWTVYMNPQTISSNQLEKFRQLNAKYGGKLVNNDRPIQPLEYNPVIYNMYD